MLLNLIFPVLCQVFPLEHIRVGNAAADVGCGAPTSLDSLSTNPVSMSIVMKVASHYDIYCERREEIPREERTRCFCC